jgi:hypothetical protein
MGYDTKFTGRLNFTGDFRVKHLSEVKKFLGEDCRDHPEWGEADLAYIDLKLTDDCLGLQWSGDEKTYELDKKINLIIEQMQKEFPDFGLEGELLAQGDEPDDRYKIIVKDGKAKIVNIVVKGTKVICPHCDEYFFVEGLS